MRWFPNWILVEFPVVLIPSPCHRHIYIIYMCKNPFCCCCNSSVKAIYWGKNTPFILFMHVQPMFCFCFFQYGHSEIARDCLKMYFMKQQPSNQFLIRAYLCQAQLLAPQNANNPVYCSVCVCVCVRERENCNRCGVHQFWCVFVCVFYTML